MEYGNETAVGSRWTNCLINAEYGRGGSHSAPRAREQLCDDHSGAEANAARKEALALLEAADWQGFDLPTADEPSAYVRYPPLR